MSDEILEQLNDVAEASVAGSDDRVDGVAARYVVRPRDTESTAAAMKVLHAHGLTSVARGGGTKLRWGTPPQRLDAIVDTTGMDQLLEHAAGDLIVRTGAGRRVAQLGEDLGQAGQRIGIDPFRSGTVGGAVATGATGPMRLFHGAVRDLVIGLTLVRGDGVIGRGGGKVVKNVAGYDLGKLLTGSWGTLGIITEVNFRLHPIAAVTRWVSTPLSGGSQLREALRELTHAQFFPSAVELDLPADGRGSLAVQIDGTEGGVGPRIDTAARLLGPAAEVSASPPMWWGAEPEGTALIKLTHQIAHAADLADEVAAATQAAGVRLALRGSPLVGTAYLGLGGELSAQAVRTVTERLRANAGRFGGTVVVLEAEPGLRDGLEVWGPVRGLDLMQAMKREFDPDRLLAPGRFVGGI